MVAVLPAAVVAAGAIGAAAINASSSKGKTPGGSSTGSSAQGVGPEATKTADLLQQKTRDYANQPYAAYTGTREAALTPDQLAAFQRTRDLTGQNLETFGALSDRTAANAQFSGVDASKGLAANVGDIATGSQGVLPGMATAANTSGVLGGMGAELLPGTLAGTANLATTLPNTDITGYMNPYIQSALNPALDDLYRNAEINRQRLNSQSARTGSFGGSRNAIAQDEAQRSTEREVGRLSATEHAKGYDNAVAQFRADQANIPKLYSSMYEQLGQGQGLQKGALDAANAQLAGRTSVINQNVLGQGALKNVVEQGAAETKPLSDLLTSGTTAIQNTVNPLLATGAIQQANEQKTIDRQYQDWLEKRDWPVRGLDQMARALSISPAALGATTNTTEQKYDAAGNPLNAVLGGALSAYGLYNQFNKDGSSSTDNSANTQYYGTNVPKGYTDTGSQAGDYPMF